MIKNCNNRYNKSGPNIYNKKIYQNEPKPIDIKKYNDHPFYVYY